MNYEFNNIQEVNLNLILSGIKITEVSMHLKNSAKD
jgi:hypothetical protein